MIKKIIYDIGQLMPFVASINNKENSSLVDHISFSTVYIDNKKLPLYYIKYSNNCEDIIHQVTLEILYYAIYHIIEDINTIEIILDEIVIKKAIREIYINNKNIFHNNSIILYISSTYASYISSKDTLFYLSLMRTKEVIIIPEEYLNGYKMLFVPKNSIDLFVFNRKDSDVIQKVSYYTKLPKFIKIKKI